jgi:hypothetical protein
VVVRITGLESIKALKIYLYFQINTSAACIFNNNNKKQRLLVNFDGLFLAKLANFSRFLPSYLTP